MTLEKNN